MENDYSEPAVYTAILATSSLYAPLLSWWKRAEPVSYHQNIWAQTAFGVTYILLFLRLIINQHTWNRVFTGFVFGGLPLIIRAMLENGRQHRELKKFNQ